MIILTLKKKFNCFCYESNDKKSLQNKRKNLQIILNIIIILFFIIKIGFLVLLTYLYFLPNIDYNFKQYENQAFLYGINFILCFFGIPICFLGSYSNFFSYKKKFSFIFFIILMIIFLKVYDPKEFIYHNDEKYFSVFVYIIILFIVIIIFFSPWLTKLYKIY